MNNIERKVDAVRKTANLTSKGFQMISANVAASANKTDGLFPRLKRVIDQRAGVDKAGCGIANSAHKYPLKVDQRCSFRNQNACMNQT